MPRRRQPKFEMGEEVIVFAGTDDPRWPPRHPYPMVRGVIVDAGERYSHFVTVRLGPPYDADISFPKKSLERPENELPNGVLSDRTRERIAAAVGRPPTTENTAPKWFRSDGEAAVILRGLRKLKLYALAEERTKVNHDTIRQHLKAGEICSELRLLMEEWMLSHRRQVPTTSGGLPGSGRKR